MYIGHDIVKRQGLHIEPGPVTHPFTLYKLLLCIPISLQKDYSVTLECVYIPVHSTK